MNTSFTADYDFRPVVTKVKILHKMAASTEDAVTNLKLFLSSEFQNLSLDFQISMSNIVFEAAKIPYIATRAQYNINVDEENDTVPWVLHIVTKEHWNA